MATSRPFPTERTSVTEAFTRLPSVSLATTEGTNSPAENRWPTENEPGAGRVTLEWTPSSQMTSSVYGGSPPVTLPSRIARAPGKRGFGPSSIPESERGTTIDTLDSLVCSRTVTLASQARTAPDRTATVTVPESKESAVNVADGPAVAFRSPVAFPGPTDHRNHSGVTRHSGDPTDQTAWRVRLEPVRNP